MAYPVMPLGFLGSQGDNDTYRIERSLRFNSADSAYLSRTPASAGNRKTWTWSGWVKRSKIATGTYYQLFGGGVGAGPNDGIFFDTTAGGIYYTHDGTASVVTSSVYRDTSAWYHIVFSVDTTQSTASNRVRVYANGIEVTSFSTASYPSQNADNTYINTTNQHRIGSHTNSGYYFDGYLTEINFIDGQALTPSSFGETDAITGRWKAKAYSGTYGTNGFYLKFADNSGTTATTLGKDSSPNGNNWTPNNFSVTAGAGNDSLVDSPTNYGTDTGVGGEVRGNYATHNPIDNSGGATLSNGNLDVAISGLKSTRSTIAMRSGKWYCECLVNTVGNTMVGLLNSSASLSQHIGSNANSWGYYHNGQKYLNNSATNYGNTYTNADIIGIAYNADSGKLWFSKNGTWQASGDPVAGTNEAYSSISGDIYFGTSNGGSATSNNTSFNFGQRPFAYTAPSGFKALCTTNLPTPIIKKPSTAMDVVTYTGNGSARSITGLGFSPDLVWIKGRSGATDHAIYDSVRGVQRDLGSNLTTDETTQTQGLTAFNSDGFDIGTLAKINTNTSTYVAWAWDRAAIDGLDIVSYTGNGANRTIAHNLGVAPRMIIIKARTTAGTDQGWPVYHSSLANTQYLLLNSTAAAATGADYWNSTSPTASVFSLGTNAAVNANNDTYIAYLFSEVEGFSRFGSWSGNASTDGPFIWCGFRPKYVIAKRDAAGKPWMVYDSGRSDRNSNSLELRPNTNEAENASLSGEIDFLSNGFKIRSDSGKWIGELGTFIFAAFAESPFKYARAR